MPNNRNQYYFKIAVFDPTSVCLSQSGHKSQNRGVKLDREATRFQLALIDIEVKRLLRKFDTAKGDDR